MTTTATTHDNFRAALAVKDLLEAEMDRAAARLKALPGVGSGPMGLTPDAVKRSPEWVAARAAFETAKARVARYNAKFFRLYKAAWKAEAMRRRDPSRRPETARLA